MRGFVVISGLPASGKSTVGAALERSLRLPLFDKDSYLEALFESEGTSDITRRREFSKRADMQFQRAAEAKRTGILVSWWKHPASSIDSGTPAQWVAHSGLFAIEVHCVCSPEIATSRFLTRVRHPGHNDSRWSRDSLLAMLQQQQTLGPLFPSANITVNTEHTLDAEQLANQVRANAQTRYT